MIANSAQMSSVPRPAWSSLARWREQWRQWRLLRAISRDMRTPASPYLSRAAGAAPIGKLLILPSDPMTLVGARGDQAMMQAVVGELRALQPSLGVVVLTGSAVADAAAREMGFEPLRAPVGAWRLQWLVGQARDRGIDGVVLLGADMMDGHYSPVFTARALGMVDMLARNGVRTVVLGFSFNDQPAVALKPLFDQLSPQTHLNVRDPISQQRLHAFTRARATLVADAAFMLRPDDASPRVAQIDAWARAQRTAKYRALGFNIHPGLVAGLGPDAVALLVRRCADALSASGDRHGLRWLLLPHDYRASGGDDQCLLPIAHALRQRGVDCLHPDQALSAAELKAVAGRLDGVITGRMHLAIATLGQAVPVACVTYQGKFEGLLSHFSLPADLLLSPEQALAEGSLEALIDRFVESLPDSRARIASALPMVLEASRRNLLPLRPESPST